MAEITGIKDVIKALKDLKTKIVNDGLGKCVVVGYTQKYALFVHENFPGKPNPPKTSAQRAAMMIAIKEREERGHIPWAVGQPKFLEQPARELDSSGEFSRLIFTALNKKATLMQALLICGLRLQRESQLLCPLEFGLLKASAFTRIEAIDGGPKFSGQQA